MIILLQSVTMQFCRLFSHILYYKVRQSNFITKCDKLLLQSASGITKCGSYYKVTRNNSVSSPSFLLVNLKSNTRYK